MTTETIATPMPADWRDLLALTKPRVMTLVVFTGLCGLAWYDADHFPKDYLGTMFLGDVVSNCISHDKIVWKGATPVAVEQPNFLTSKDRWFRPVDIKLGPDGALYVADFYNKIIGHYEVDLKHPGRDKKHGRIWRIVWKGKGEPGVSTPEERWPSNPSPGGTAEGSRRCPLPEESFPLLRGDRIFGCD